MLTRALIGLCCLVACGMAGKGETPMQSPSQAPVDPASPLRVEVSRVPGGLDWRVENQGQSPVWAWLLVPGVVDGRASFAVDAAWTAMEGDLLVLRKVDTPVPEDRDADRVNAGALRLQAGASRTGHLALSDPPRASVPYGRPSALTLSPARVTLEVGWVLDSAQITPKMADWQGQPFAWIRSEDLAGGQQLSRAAPVAW
jgi:hypothetical protein